MSTTFDIAQENYLKATNKMVIKTSGSSHNTFEVAPGMLRGEHSSNSNDSSYDL